MQWWALIVDSFRESRDRKIFWVMTVISVVVAGGMFCIGFEPHKIVILFGVGEYETDYFTTAGEVRSDFIAGIMVHFIWDLLLGWVGVTLAVIATGGFFPALIERGAIDVVLSKPIARWQIFLGKYCGGMVFILVQAALFVFLTFLVIGFRWGIWLPGYLWSIPLMVLLFSYVYCVSALVAVFLRSAVAAVLLSLGAWVAFSGVQTTADYFEMYPSWQQQQSYYNAARAARWIIPKTQDVTYLAARWSGTGAATDMMPEPDLNDEDAEMLTRAGEVERMRMNVNALHTIGSSLLFEAFIVLLAMWKFSREDF